MFTTNDCIDYMVNKLPQFKEVIKPMLDALEANFESIHELELVNEEMFIRNYLEKHFNIYEIEIQQTIIDTYYNYF